MKKIYGTAIIRDRGQLTIPEKIRDALVWPSSNSVISLIATPDNELLIRPYRATQKTDWKNIWKEIAKARATKGKNGNLSQFVSLDRNNH